MLYTNREQTFTNFLFQNKESDTFNKYLATTWRKLNFLTLNSFSRDNINTKKNLLGTL